LLKVARERVCVRVRVWKIVWKQAELATNLDKGMTFSVNRAAAVWPGVAKLVVAAQQAFRVRANANLYVTREGACRNQWKALRRLPW
jgi:hypothetical protein